jgi:ABC-type branched-subunit amino acid transport system ATPase component/branched-subunit amino acid ABC-type transport system permease component
MSHIGFLLLGLGAGAAYASLAMALVVTYRSSGVINFASGSLAVYGAYIYAFLRKGQFVPMIPGFPKFVGAGGSWPFVPALLAALVLTALLGLVLYLVVFRPLRTAPPLARLVASLGVQVSIVLLITKRMGTVQVPVANIFPDKKFRLGVSVGNWKFIWTAVAVIAVAGLVSALYRYTRFGLVTRAVAESEKGAHVSRISASRISALNWMLSSALAAFAGIMIAPLTSVVPAVYTLFIVPSLAACVVARFDKLTTAVVGGLVIGMLESEARFLPGTYSWFPKKGGAEMVSLIVILAVLLLRSRPLPERGAIIQRSLGRAPRPRHLIITTLIFVPLGVVLLYVLQGPWRQALIVSFVFGIISLSFVVITGYAGQISLAQMTLAGASAYTLSFLTESWNIPFPIAPIMSALFATVIGVLVGLPALRIRGLSVAVVTLSLAVTVDSIWFRNTDIVGFSGRAEVKDPKLFGWNLGFGTGRGATHIPFGILTLLVLGAAAFGVALLRRSQLGSAMLAVRANERSAAAAGVNVVQVKLFAFTIGSFIAGVGGAMLTYRYGAINDTQFSPLLGLSIFATAYLAGITSVMGGVAAGLMAITGLAYTATSTWLHLGNWYQLISSLLLIVTVISNPEGIVGQNHLWADQLEARRKARALAAAGITEQPTVEMTGERLVAAPIDISGLPAIMEVRNLGVRYGGVVAVSDVSFDIPKGAIVGLIGPNGAGKTTMVDALSGFARCTGSITFDGADIGTLKPHQRVKAGLSRTFQAIELYDDLAVQENLTVGLASGRQGHGAAAMRSLDATCDVLRLTPVRDRPAGDLSQGQRQLVSVGRAMVAQPTLLLLDEPAAGLDSSESEWLGGRLRDVRDKGVTILIVDHDVNLVLNLCDYIVVLDFGRLIAKGTPAEIRSNPQVIAAYLGATHSAPAASAVAAELDEESHR